MSGPCRQLAARQNQAAVEVLGVPAGDVLTGAVHQLVLSGYIWLLVTICALAGQSKTQRSEK